MRLEAPRSARQWLVHGDVDDVVPVEISRNYYQRKRKSEIVELLEIKKAGHFDVIDPRSAAWTMIEQVVLRLTVKSSPPQRQ
jgi:pimeloyl-ACP methyl ester carboxylesterase